MCTISVVKLPQNRINRPWNCKQDKWGCESLHMSYNDSNILRNREPRNEWGELFIARLLCQLFGSESTVEALHWSGLSIQSRRVYHQQLFSIWHHQCSPPPDMMSDDRLSYHWTQTQSRKRNSQGDFCVQAACVVLNTSLHFMHNYMTKNMMWCVSAKVKNKKTKKQKTERDREIQLCCHGHPGFPRLFKAVTSNDAENTNRSRSFWEVITADDCSHHEHPWHLNHF